jgi:hypothetical protein
MEKSPNLVTLEPTLWLCCGSFISAGLRNDWTKMFQALDLRDYDEKKTLAPNVLCLA